MGQQDENHHDEQTFDDGLDYDYDPDYDLVEPSLFPGDSAEPSDDPIVSVPSINPPDTPDTTCQSAAYSACRDDIEKFCAIPADLSDIPAHKWLKRCIHDFWKDEFNSNCEEKVYDEWGRIKMEKGFDVDSEPMASDILEIMTCQEDEGCDHQHRQHRHHQHHGRGENDNYDRHHGRGKHHIRGRRFHKLLMVLFLGLCLTCCICWCYRCHKRKQRAAQNQSGITTATVGSPSQRNNEQRSSAPPPLYPIVGNDRNMQHTIQAVPDTTFSPAHVALHV